jgi:hypothetical protein
MGVRGQKYGSTILKLAPTAAPFAGENEALQAVVHDLDVRPQRPGELTVPVVVTLAPTGRTAASLCAKRDGVPINLWLVIAIEAERALRNAAARSGVDLEELEARLDHAAGRVLPSDVYEHPALQALRAYAHALLTMDDSPVPVMATTSVPLNPGLQVAAAWAVEADVSGLEMAAWATERASELPFKSRVAWEAAAASWAQSLAEWTLLQAAR